jgi:Mg-chelatase subunit ChlD
MNATTYCYGTTLAVRLEAVPAAVTQERSLSIAFLLDNSGSMEGPRMDAVKRTLHAARSLFRSEDRVTLVIFSEVARVLHDHLLMTNDGIEAFYTAVDGIRADASTNLSAGIEALFGCGRDYDLVIVLTDGMVNAGITSTAGLRAMILGAAGSNSGLAFHALGYGADHNRTLLRDIATRSLGTYTFVESDEILPIAMADTLSGARAECLQNVRVSPPAGWTCLEAAGECVGNLMPGRDYWCVFTRPEAIPDTADAGVMMVSTTTAGVALVTQPVVARPLGEMTPEVTEQRFRALIAAEMVALSNRAETGGRVTTDRLTALRTELEAVPETVRTRPLMLRLAGQIAEILAMIPTAAPEEDHAPALRGGLRAPGLGLGWGHPPLRAPAMARLASNAAVLCTQRGVYESPSAAAGEEDDPLSRVSFFSTPSQRVSSSAVRSTYTRSVTDPSTGPS